MKKCYDTTILYISENENCFVFELPIIHGIYMSNITSIKVVFDDIELDADRIWIEKSGIEVNIHHLSVIGSSFWSFKEPVTFKIKNDTRVIGRGYKIRIEMSYLMSSPQCCVRYVEHIFINCSYKIACINSVYGLNNP